SDLLHRAVLRVGLAAGVGETLIRAMHDAEDHDRRLRFRERVEHLVAERDELSLSNLARALQQFSRVAENLGLALRDVVEALAIVDEEEVVRDRVALKKKIVVGLEAFRVLRETELVSLRVGGRAEQHEAVHDFIVEQIADRKMAAEHVLAEDAAVAAKADPLGIQGDLRIAAEVAHDVAAAGGNLLEEEAAIDVGSGHDGEVFDRLADEPLM